MEPPVSAPTEFVLPFPERSLRVRAAVDGPHHDDPHGDPHWARLWPAALALAGAVLRKRWPLPDDEVLELGCGTGLVSLALAAAGGRVRATDRSTAALSLVTGAACDNGLADNLVASRLDWTAAPTRRWPLIVAADVLYQTEAVAPLARFLRHALTDHGLALVVDPDRASARHFHLHAQQAGLRCELKQLPVPFIDQHGPVVALADPATPLTVTLFVLQPRTT